jgi:hypothetical protein
MAINETRSLNTDLTYGKDDGRIKRLAPDRGGEVELERLFERADALQRQYSIADYDYNVHKEGCSCGNC